MFIFHFTAVDYRFFIAKSFSVTFPTNCFEYCALQQPNSNDSGGGVSRSRLAVWSQFRHSTQRLCGRAEGPLNGANSWALPRLTTSWQELASLQDVCSVSTFFSQNPLLWVWPLLQPESLSASYPTCKLLFRQDRNSKNKSKGLLFHVHEFLSLWSEKSLGKENTKHQVRFIR